MIVSSLTGGGAEGICVNIANSFANNGWHVDLVVLNLNNEAYLDRISNNVNLFVLNVNHSRNSIFTFIKIFIQKKDKNSISI